ncbi:PHP domain-containing protein [Leadbettera azotonutricia]|uniref:PHP domain protein n=1 Tax=Leadbettera azotonutricia (strain ATCC BAA-888 / DSM 13862 / ZAS-9) TaxID=545695 RepID=F5YDW7_LEAAZ|nr:PHP domain-containing protein [Leadbettera azotonutricia]AEF82646.1 PHP domain protein [Leadbettera azotonutricia ZAS-9]
MALLADFHNHSCLSPCGSLDLSPRNLACLASARGIKVLALTDHNSSLNCPAFAKVCPPLGILPLFGMEATTQEEIHALCLFTNLEASLAWSEYAYSLILPFPNDPEKTGDQVYVDEEDNIEGEVEYFLPSALDFSIEYLGTKVAEYGGIVIPAHVDRSAFSMASQLGVVVKGPWAALECVRLPPRVYPPNPGSAVPSARREGSPLNTLGYPLTTSSDAHYPEDVGRRPFELDVAMEELAPHGVSGEADMEALKEALRKRPRF